MLYHNLQISKNGLYLILPINGVYMGLDEDTLSEILSAHTVGIRSIKSEEGSTEFLKMYCALEDLNNKAIDKRISRENFSCSLSL